MTKVVTGGLRVNSQNIMLMNNKPCLACTVQNIIFIFNTFCILLDSSFWFDTINLG